MLQHRAKIRPLAGLVKVRDRLRREGRRVVLTNGCFDLLHPGHVEYLAAAKRFGDVLIVALNGDRSVRALKGCGRPILPQKARAEMLAALAAVDYIVIFQAKRATRVMAALRPDVYVKGGDYRLETLDAQERAALAACGTRIRLVRLKPGFSTTALVRKIQRLPKS
ncbi:MAG: adenylyltransferase/cytidyltransferase family protein [Verrucomicrobiae bacterium]|nr:adenylyltransferase/cytidyltransferase family protein [Verrucomicrobiae bacterium]